MLVVWSRLLQWIPPTWQPEIPCAVGLWGNQPHKVSQAAPSETFIRATVPRSPTSIHCSSLSINPGHMYDMEYSVWPRKSKGTVRMFAVCHLIPDAVHAVVHMVFLGILCAVIAGGVVLGVAYVNTLHWPPSFLTLLVAAVIAVLAMRLAWPPWCATFFVASRISNRMSSKAWKVSSSPPQGVDRRPAGFWREPAYPSSHPSGLPTLTSPGSHVHASAT
jgi:hypothetical protein